MVSKFLCASLLAVASSHSLQARDTSLPSGGYSKVNRDSGYAAPASSYSASAPSYSPSAPSYSAPAASYNAPASSYGTPDVSYNAPSAGYGETESKGGFDLTLIIIPILALIGLSLLFPTFVSVSATGRKKRGTEIEGGDSVNDVVERMNDIFMSVVQSENCIERIACELGGLANDYGLRESSVGRMIDPFVTGKYKSYYKQFRSGENCQTIKCGSF